MGEPSICINRKTLYINRKRYVQSENVLTVKLYVVTEK